MKVADSVRHAIDDWSQGTLESAMLHACNAVDGTASKLYPNSNNKERFTRFLRENFDILGPMGAPGVNLEETRFPVELKGPTAVGGPDIADVLYGVHRCCHAYGDELPEGFALIEDARATVGQTRTAVGKGKVRLSDRMIFALLATAVLAPINQNQSDPALEGYYLAFGRSATLVINDWWGELASFPKLPQESQYRMSNSILGIGCRDGRGEGEQQGVVGR